ncbi:MAG: hypothetical protein HY343_07795 [Lentisphaerae bacterium]|nr:hypothetical protein [Lentisphaerota bacterium]
MLWFGVGWALTTGGIRWRHSQGEAAVEKPDVGAMAQVSEKAAVADQKTDKTPEQAMDKKEPASQGYAQPPDAETPIQERVAVEPDIREETRQLFQKNIETVRILIR